MSLKVVGAGDVTGSGTATGTGGVMPATTTTTTTTPTTTTTTSTGMPDVIARAMEWAATHPAEVSYVPIAGYTAGGTPVSAAGQMPVNPSPAGIIVPQTVIPAETPASAIPLLVSIAAAQGSQIVVNVPSTWVKPSPASVSGPGSVGYVLINPKQTVMDILEAQALYPGAGIYVKDIKPGERLLFGEGGLTIFESPIVTSGIPSVSAGTLPSVSAGTQMRTTMQGPIVGYAIQEVATPAVDIGQPVMIQLSYYGWSTPPQPVPELSLEQRLLFGPVTSNLAQVASQSMTPWTQAFGDAWGRISRGLSTYETGLGAMEYIAFGLTPFGQILRLSGKMPTYETETLRQMGEATLGSAVIGGVAIAAPEALPFLHISAPAILGGTALGVGVSEGINKLFTGTWLPKEAIIPTALGTEAFIIGGSGLLAGMGATGGFLRQIATSPIGRALTWGGFGTGVGAAEAKVTGGDVVKSAAMSGLTAGLFALGGEAVIMYGGRVSNLPGIRQISDITQGIKDIFAPSKEVRFSTQIAGEGEAAQIFALEQAEGRVPTTGMGIEKILIGPMGEADNPLNPPHLGLGYSKIEPEPVLRGFYGRGIDTDSAMIDLRAGALTDQLKASIVDYGKINEAINKLDVAEVGATKIGATEVRTGEQAAVLKRLQKGIVYEEGYNPIFEQTYSRNVQPLTKGISEPGIIGIPVLWQAFATMPRIIQAPSVGTSIFERLNLGSVLNLKQTPATVTKTSELTVLKPITTQFTRELQTPINIQSLRTDLRRTTNQTTRTIRVPAVVTAVDYTQIQTVGQGQRQKQAPISVVPTYQMTAIRPPPPFKPDFIKKSPIKAPRIPKGGRWLYEEKFNPFNISLIPKQWRGI